MALRLQRTSCDSVFPKEPQVPRLCRNGMITQVRGTRFLLHLLGQQVRIPGRTLRTLAVPAVHHRPQGFATFRRHAFLVPMERDGPAALHHLL